MQCYHQILHYTTHVSLWHRSILITDAYRCLCFGGSYEINDKFLVDNGLDNHGFFSQQRELHCLCWYSRDIPALHTFSRLASWLRQALKNTLNARVKSRFAVPEVLLEPEDIETTLLCTYVGWKRNGRDVFPVYPDTRLDLRNSKRL